MPNFPDPQTAHHHVVSPQANGISSQAYITRRLPLDVLHEIFFHTAQISQSGMPREESMLTPLRLLQVCRTWHHVAMSCPPLWAYITILLDGQSSSGRDRWFSRAVDTFIERSRASPLSLLVTCSTVRYTTPHFDTVGYILSRLLDQQNRWREACFTLENVDPPKLPEIRLANVPVLESLRVTVERKSTWVDLSIGVVHIDFSRSQRLGSLFTAGIHVKASGGQLYSLKQLTFFGCYAKAQQMDHLDVIRRAPHLEFLGISSTGTWWDNPQSSMLMLHKLHTLFIDDSYVSMSLFSNIVLPALKHLVCGPLNRGHSYRLLHLLKLTQPPLEVLEITGPCAIQDLFSLLRIFPDLQTLCMRGICITPDFFDMLSIAYTIDSHDGSQAVSSILCPKLTELCLKNLRYRSDDKDLGEECINSLCNTLEKRCNALGVVGSIEYQPIEPLPAGETPYFNVPFVNIGCTRMRRALITTKQLDVRFKKILTAQSAQNFAEE